MRLFYRRNDTDVRPTADDAFALITAVANGALDDVGATARRLRAWRS